MAAVKFTAANSNFDSDLRKPLHEEMMRWADAKKEGIWRWGNPRSLSGKQALSSLWQQIVRQDHGRGPVLGFIDMVVVGPASFSSSSSPLMLSIHTEIKVLSEVIREVRLNQSGWVMFNVGLGWRVQACPYVLISPDDRYAAMLQEQGIKFLKYDPAFKFPVVKETDSNI